MEYFEELADLIEEERELEFDEVYEALGDVSSEDMGEILENYMEEILNFVPDAEQELYLLIENIKTGLLFLCENLEDENTKSQFAEELCRFKNWYTKEESCTVDGYRTSVFSAVTENRSDKLTGEESEFDFSDALDYELKDFSMSIGRFQGIDILGDDTEDEPELDATDGQLH